MIQSNYFSTNEDIQNQFDKILDWEEIVKECEVNFRDAELYKKNGDEKYSMAPTTVSEAVEYYRSILDSLGELMGHEVAPRSAEMERVGLKYESGKVIYPDAQNHCYNVLRDSGLLPIGLGRKHGGLGLPMVLQVMCCEIAARADAAFALAFGSVTIAEVVERYGSDEMVDEWIPQLAAGKYSCAMALTEPNYGSDLPNVQLKAVKDEKGNWKLTGTKRFITHAAGYDKAPCIILTLARTGGVTSGARGLSFFLVHQKDVQIAGIEKKMGLHCSPTCEVVYENAPAKLIGEEGMGLVRYSMGMMNAARMTVGAQALGIAEAALCEAKKYASERVQFGKPIEAIPAVRKMLDNMECEIAAMRCLILEAGRAIDLYHWKKEHMLKDQKLSEKEVRNEPSIRRWEKLADLFTPISKYYISEESIKIASDALQIHGGAGYTEEYDVARIYRDSRITTIYEGTTQLQIVAAIGGFISGMAPAGHLREYLDEELSKIKQSEELKSLRDSFEKTVNLYKEIEDSASKSRVAFETVETGSRYLLGLLMERSAAKLDGESKKKRQKLCAMFNANSLAIAAANLVHLEMAKRPVLV